MASFGAGGEIDLAEGLLWPINRKHYSNTSPPVVYRDLVILGNGVGDRLMYKNDPPGDVRAFDARTGKLAWTFHTIPQPGRVRPRNVAERRLEVHRPHQRVGRR